MLSDRRFGVEIECGLPGGCDKAWEILEGPFPDWCDDIHEDGTAVEISSPILQGENGFAQLREVYNILLSNGGYVTRADGMHIHHDAPEFLEDEDAVIRIVEMWAANQELIDTLVHHSRRDSWACAKTWTPMSVARMKMTHKDPNGNWLGGRGALNVSALRRYGTIEFRQHEGTLDFATAASWIQFGQAFMASALRRKTPLLTCTTPKELLYRIRTDRSSAAILLSKDTEGSMDQPHDPNDYCDCETCFDQQREYEESYRW